MFTGIIESVGRVVSLESRAESARLGVQAPEIAGEVTLGASIAVNGACLTVVAAGNGVVHFDVIRESLERTNLGQLEPGDRVNLERALRADGRLDGHFVQGHVDGTGRVDRMDRDGEDVRLAVQCAPELAALLVPKGSVAIDGVSLTVVGAGSTGFDVALIPHTLEVTTLGERRAGDRVNLEVDVLAKYVQHAVAQMLSPGDPSG